MRNQAENEGKVDYEYINHSLYFEIDTLYLLRTTGMS